MQYELNAPELILIRVNPNSPKATNLFEDIRIVANMSLIPRINNLNIVGYVNLNLIVTYVLWKYDYKSIPENISETRNSTNCELELWKIMNYIKVMLMVYFHTNRNCEIEKSLSEVESYYVTALI